MIPKGVLVVCAVLTPLNSAISNSIDQQTTLTEQDRRAAEKDKNSDLKASETRGLWVVGQNPYHESYPSAEGVGYEANVGYGHTGNGYLNNYGDYYGNNAYGLTKPSSSGYGFGHSGYGHGYTVQEYEYEHPEEHKGGGLLSISKGLALKKLLLPLAGLALLGTAAALSTHPVLLQLGTISSGRRKRSIKQTNIYPLNPMLKPVL